MGLPKWLSGKATCQCRRHKRSRFDSWVRKIYAEYIMRNAGLDEAQAGIRIDGRNINNLRYADDTILMAESIEEPLDESERGE